MRRGGRNLELQIRQSFIPVGMHSVLRSAETDARSMIFGRARSWALYRPLPCRPSRGRRGDGEANIILDGKTRARARCNTCCCRVLTSHYCRLERPFGLLGLLVSCISRGQDWIARCGLNFESTTTIHEIKLSKTKMPRTSNARLTERKP